MKKLHLFILAAFLIFAACKSDENTDDNANENSEVTENGTETEVAVKLNPDKINLEKPIKPEELEEAVFAWNNVKEITVTAYCAFFFDEGKIGNGVELVLNPGDKIERGNPDAMNIKCEMKQEYPEEFDRSIPVTIKGEVELSFGRNFVMKNSELVKKGETVENKGYIDAENYKGENISLDDFYASYFGWMDKEVTVIGYYQSSTKSTTSYGETLRVDLKSDDGSVTVGCRLASGVTVPEGLENNREGVIIKGIIKGEAFGNVIMEECTFVNR